MAKETVLTKAHIVLVGLLIVASFFLGKLYTQVQYLQSADAGAAGAQEEKKGKYEIFDQAMADLANKAKLNAKDLVTCMNSGGKKEAVDEDASEAQIAGVTGTPAFFINGKLLGGAFPFESFKEIIDKELDGTGSTDPADYSQNLQEAAKAGAFDPRPKNITVGDAHVKGKGGTPVVIVEFSDFQCPYCATALPTVQQVLKEYGDKVLFAYKHLPLVSIHPLAQKTAEASECAADQGKFWEFHDQLFLNQQDWTTLQ